MRRRIAALQRSAILRQIWVHGPQSRASLARRLKLRPSSVTSLTRELLDTGLLREVGEGRPNGGRPPLLLDVDRAGNYALALTVESRGLTVALVRWDAQVPHRVFEPIRPDENLLPFLQAVTRTCERVLAEAGVGRERVRGVGVGISALVDPAANEAVFSSTLAAVQRLRLDFLAQSLGLPVYLEDIAYMMALGERWFVYPGDHRALVMVYVGGGTCGAILEPWARPHSPRFACEFGHMVVDPDGPPCGCGKRGCLEAYVSERALLVQAEQLFGRRNGVSPTLAAVAEWAKEGDPAARQFIAAAGEYLGVMLANLVNVLAPALVVVGGSLLDTWGSLLWAELERCLQEHALPQLLRQVEVVPARLGEDAALIGCAARVMQAVWESPEAAPERGVLGRAAAAQA